MLPDPTERLAGRAREFLEAATTSYENGRYNVAYEEARTAAELVAKALLQRATGTYPREHNPSSELTHHRLLPPTVNAARLSKLLRDWSRGPYAFQEPVDRVEAKDAIVLARSLVRVL